ncbi:MAG: hypothetical protein HYW16_02315 [Candidatus Rokubacteria bacterium]|nr:hypothetical protein [Candidatus Rokubacteria bacterium]
MIYGLKILRLLGRFSLYRIGLYRSRRFESLRARYSRFESGDSRPR